MRSEARLETRPDRIELFVRDERIGSYLHNAPVPGLSPLRVEQRAVTQAVGEDGVAIWFGHADLAGFAIGEFADGCFFGEFLGRPSGRYRTEELVARRGSQSVGLQHTCVCVAPDGRKLLTEVRTLRIQPGPAQGALLDLRLELQAPDDSEVILPRSDRGLLRLGLAPAFLGSGGTIRNSVGEYGSEIDRRSAAWCGCVGVVSAATVGMVVLDHPHNPAHPPLWNLNASGTLEVDPHFWQDTVIAAGTSVEFRYRLLTHAGYVEQGWADRQMREFAAPRP